MGEEISWHIELRVKPGQLDNFRTLTGEMVAVTRREPGVLSYQRFVERRWYASPRLRTILRFRRCGRVADPDLTSVRAHAHARAREKSLKNFRLVPLRRRYVQRRRALAVIIPIMPTSELVWLGRHGAA